MHDSVKKINCTFFRSLSRVFFVNIYMFISENVFIFMCKNYYSWVLIASLINLENFHSFSCPSHHIYFNCARKLEAKISFHFENVVANNLSSILSQLKWSRLKIVGNNKLNYYFELIYLNIYQDSTAVRNYFLFQFIGRLIIINYHWHKLLFKSFCGVWCCSKDYLRIQNKKPQN